MQYYEAKSEAQDGLVRVLTAHSKLPRPEQEALCLKVISWQVIIYYVYQIFSLSLAVNLRKGRGCVRNRNVVVKIVV